jgi:predicted acylesterase/phospholipase RssA
MKKCDIVMKGGITSGIVYPGVVCKLSEKYDFQNVGGTSAGGIAAALTAAAELARRQGRNVFPELAKVPAFLGADAPKPASGSNLFNLFQPQPGMKGLFHVATAFLLQGFGPVVGAVLRVLWLESLLGFAFGATVIYFGWQNTGWKFWLLWPLGFLAIFVAVLVFGASGLLIRLRCLSSHHYGFCFGYTKRTSDKQPISLVEWLNEKLNSFAALPKEEPLTFGHLSRCVNADNPHGITLKMISTCLTFGRPFTLPFDSHVFYFSPSELSNYLPAEVIAWMENHPPQPPASDEHHGRKIDLGGLKPLPDADDLPVILAVRLSLSFPFLFCAVPLYAVDFTRRERAPGDPVPAKRTPGDALGPDDPFTAERVWFADGGITSNFPFHLFDSPIPRWPTFGLDLDDFRPDMTEKSPRTWMPTSNVGGIAPVWTRLGTLPSFTSVVPFASSMIDAARNWMDNLQTTVPGYRDRIVHVFLTKHEGGLNLNMPPTLLNDLSGYGEEAADHLIQHFLYGTDDGKPTRMTWDNHRWIRYRSSTSLLGDFLAHYASSADNPEPGDLNIMTLVARRKGDPPPTGYPFSPEQREIALEFTDRLIKLGTEMKDKDLQTNGPRPEPALRVRPKF